MSPRLRRRAALAACVLVLAPTASRAADRSVTIIEGALEPAAPAPPMAEPPRPLPDALAAPPKPPPPAAPAVVQADPALPNEAGLSVAMLPNRSVSVGEHIGFRIATRSPGYLLLFDIDAGGQVMQIYPSAAAVARLGDAAAGMNAITPASPVRVPDPSSPVANFTFRAAPPRGAGLVVAALRGTPVAQMDLSAMAASGPDLPGQVKRLVKALRGGDAAAADGWSFATFGYTIR